MREYYGNVLQGICQHANINLWPDVDPFATSYQVSQLAAGSNVNLSTNLDWLMFPQLNQGSGTEWNLVQNGDFLVLLESIQGGTDSVHLETSSLSDCV
jgi:hypothetical protein